MFDATKITVRPCSGHSKASQISKLSQSSEFIGSGSTTPSIQAIHAAVKRLLARTETK